MAVTHQLKSVRRHHIEVKLPTRPPSDHEAFVIDFVGQGNGASLELTAGDFLTLIGVFGKSWLDVTGDELRTNSELRDLRIGALGARVVSAPRPIVDAPQS